MSFVATQPETLMAAASRLHRAGSAMAAPNAATAASITGVIAPAGDAISALTATQFATHAAMCAVVSAHAAVIHHLFVSILGVSAGSYAATEAANTVAAG